MNLPTRGSDESDNKVTFVFIVKKVMIPMQHSTNKSPPNTIRQRFKIVRRCHHDPRELFEKIILFLNQNLHSTKSICQNTLNPYLFVSEFII